MTNENADLQVSSFIPHPSPDSVQTPGNVGQASPPAGSDGVPPSLYARTKITRNGLTIFKRYPGENAEYYVRFSANGRRVLRQLTRTAEESFKLARRLLDASAAGRFDVLDATRARAPQCATIGQVLERYARDAAAVRNLRPRTVRGNINALRHLVRSSLQVSGLSPQPSVEALPLTVLDRALGEGYKARAIAGAGADQLKRRSAAVSANSALRQARSVFAKKLGPDFYHGLQMPDTLPKFLAVAFLPVEAKRFRMPDPALLDKLQASAPLLAQTDPSSFLIYLLSMGAGMRKGEIAHARLRWIESGRAVTALDSSGAPQTPLPSRIRVQTESDFTPKDHEERQIPLDPHLLAVLQQLTVGRQPDDYILPGSAGERETHAFRRFAAWLATMGWDRPKKCHEMRKIFGSLVTEQAGIRAAQVLLGHASVRTTEQYYADPAAGLVGVTIFKPQTAKVA